MLSPDIWTLNPPNTRITHRHEPLSAKFEHQLKQTIRSHHFNSLVNM